MYVLLQRFYMLSTVIRLGLIKLVKVMLKLMKTCFIINYLRQFMKVNNSLYQWLFRYLFYYTKQTTVKGLLQMNIFKFFQQLTISQSEKIRTVVVVKISKHTKILACRYKIFKLSFHCFIEVYITLIFPFTNSFQCFVFANNIVIPFRLQHFLFFNNICSLSETERCKKLDVFVLVTCSLSLL